MAAGAGLEVSGRGLMGCLMEGQLSKMGREQRWLKERGKMRIKEKELRVLGRWKVSDPIWSNC